jgi:hypothetical protein
MSAEQVLGGLLDQPGDPRVGLSAPERRQGGERVGDVSQGGELDDEDVQGSVGRGAAGPGSGGR